MMSLRTLLLLPAGLWFALSGIAQTTVEGWSIRQVADPDYINREPTVGENGTVAWHGHGTKDPGEEGGGEAIFIWKNGKLLNLTEKEFDVRAAHMRPIVRGDRVIWQTTRTPYANKRKPHTWVLREVPDDQRDYPYKELEAFYINANKLVAEGVEGNFNLRPDMQVYAGPATNFAQYWRGYLQPDSVKVTNVFGVVSTEAADEPVDDSEQAFRERLESDLHRYEAGEADLDRALTRSLASSASSNP